MSAVDRRGPIDSVSFQFNSQSDQRLPVTLQDSSPSTANVKELQVQTKTNDGKKRIQPVLLQDNGNISQSYFDGSLLSDTVVPPTYDDYDPCRRNCDNTLDMNGNIEFGLKSKSGGLSVNKRAGSDNSDQKKRLRQQSVPYISMDNWICTIPRPLRDSGNSVWIIPIGTDITQNMGYDAQTKSLTSIVDEITLQLRESDGSISTELSVTMKQHDQATDADPSEGILSTRISGIANIDSEVTCVAVADAHASHLLLNMTHFTPKEINFIVYGTISGRLDVLSLITGASIEYIC